MAKNNILEKVFNIMTVKTVTIGLAGYFIIQYIIYSMMPSLKMLIISFASVILLAYMLKTMLYTPTYQTHFAIGILAYITMTGALILSKEIAVPPSMYTEMINAVVLGGATTLSFKILGK